MNKAVGKLNLPDSPFVICRLPRGHFEYQNLKSQIVTFSWGRALKRAENYKNVFRREMTNVWPKDADGNWIEPYDPGFSGGRGGRAYTSEMNGYVFNWDVQHDFDGLAKLMGGYSAAQAKLDTLFRGDLSRPKAAFLAAFTDSTGLVGQFSIGDQPGFAIPYLYIHVGAPWKTQKRVRQLVDYWFTDTPLGIPGDEDNGATSAWVVFSMMGFYPVVPGVSVYELGSPIFDRVKIHLANGKSFTLVCHDNSRANKYIKSVRLNQRSQDQVWFRHSDVLKGLALDLPSIILRIWVRVCIRPVYRAGVANLALSWALSCP